MASASSSSVGKCPKCGSYHSRIRTELLSYGDSPSAGAAQPVSERTRVFLCNSCAHVWSETVKGDSAPPTTPPP